MPRTYTYGSKNSDQSQINWDRNNSRLTSLGVAELPPLACFLLLLAMHIPLTVASNDDKQKQSGLVESKNLPTRKAQATPSQSALVSHMLFSAAATKVSRKELQQPDKNTAISPASTDKPLDAESYPWLDSELTDLINNVDITIDDKDAVLLNMNKEEYSRYCSQFQARVRKNLKFAAPPDVLKNILKSKDHRILIKPDRLQIGGAYSPKLNVVVICMNDAMTDEMIQVTLRNEYFHAMTCTPMGEIHTKPQDKCLDSSQITLLHKAVLKGHNRIHRLEFDFKYHLANPQVKLESASKLSKFLNVINFYQDFRTIEYQTKEQYQQFIRYLPHTRLPDGRLHVPKGAITLSGKKSLADSYLTVTPIHNQIRITISFLKDNSVNSKASAFFADFQLLQDRYANVNFYGGESLSKKVQNWGSDAAQLPAQLKGLLYPEFCEIADSISGFKDYCGIQETTLVCESDECRISPR